MRRSLAALAHGEFDVVAALGAPGEVTVRLGFGDGTFAAEQAFDMDDGPRDLALADVDGDGELDLVTADDGTGDVTVLLKLR